MWLNKRVVPEYCQRLPLVAELRVIESLVLYFCYSFHGNVLTETEATGRPRAGALDKNARLVYVVCLGA